MTLWRNLIDNNLMEFQASVLNLDALSELSRITLPEITREFLKKHC